MKVSYNHVLKVIIVGNSGVGKSCMLLKYTDPSFTSEYLMTTPVSVGIDFKIKNVEVGGENIKLQLWDTAGQERYHAINCSLYRGADAVIIAFDLTNPDSFARVPWWMNEMRKFTDEYVITILVGTKSDAAGDNRVKEADVLAFAASCNLPYFATSIKTDEGLQGIKQIFDVICEKALAAGSQPIKSKKRDLHGFKLVPPKKSNKLIRIITSCFGGSNL